MGRDPGRWCLQTQADSHVTTSFHSVAGLPTAFLPLRKDSPLRIGFSPGCRAGLHLLACGDGRHCGWQGAGLLGAVPACCEWADDTSRWARGGLCYSGDMEGVGWDEVWPSTSRLCVWGQRGATGRQQVLGGQITS